MAPKRKSSTKKSQATQPTILGKLVMVGANQKRYAPSVQSIKEHYFNKYRGKGGEHEDNEE
jgi:hypothetical protein|tara:strand:- start:3 stop:185 length:183 start_codon:yes stop_codon:yes gene_type:complete